MKKGQYKTRRFGEARLVSPQDLCFMRAERDYWSLVLAYQALNGNPMPDDLIAKVRELRTQREVNSRREPSRLVRLARATNEGVSDGR